MPTNDVCEAIEERASTELGTKTLAQLREVLKSQVEVESRVEKLRRELYERTKGGIVGDIFAYIEERYMPKGT